MNAWKRLICRGNRSFERGRLDDAADQYVAALCEADHCIGCVAKECIEAEKCARRERCTGPDGGMKAADDGRYLDAVAAIAAYVVTRLNLADLCLRLDRSDEAAIHLREMQARLDAIIDDVGQPWTLRAAALRNSRRAQDAVLSFVAAHDVGVAGPTCAFERPITHLPPSPVLH